MVARIIAGALVAFLIFNFNPAKIFMGDCGSLVIGFSLAVLGLYFSEDLSTISLVGFFVPLLIMLVPLLDTSLVTVIRF